MPYIVGIRDFATPLCHTDKTGALCHAFRTTVPENPSVYGSGIDAT